MYLLVPCRWHRNDWHIYSYWQAESCETWLWLAHVSWRTAKTSRPWFHQCCRASRRRYLQFFYPTQAPTHAYVCALSTVFCSTHWCICTHGLHIAVIYFTHPPTNVYACTVYNTLQSFIPPAIAYACTCCIFYSTHLCICTYSLHSAVYLSTCSCICIYTVSG